MRSNVRSASAYFRCLAGDAEADADQQLRYHQRCCTAVKREGPCVIGDGGEAKHEGAVKIGTAEVVIGPHRDQRDREQQPCGKSDAV
jgi:hypothetical protein